MKRLAVAVALAALAAAPAMADTHKKNEAAQASEAKDKAHKHEKNEAAQASEAKDKADANKSRTVYVPIKNDEFYASTLIGARVYASEKDVNDAQETRQEWDDIGEINNLIVSRDGQVKSVIIGVGGFLGVGEKDVAVKMASLRFVREKGAEDSDDYFIVTKSTKKELEAAPAHEE